MKKHELTQFSRREYEQEIVNLMSLMNEPTLTIKQRGMLEFYRQVVTPDSELNRELGGEKNISRIRVLGLRGVESNAVEVAYSFIIPPAVIRERAEEERRKAEKLAKQKAHEQAKAKEAARLQAKAKKDAKAAEEKRKNARKRFLLSPQGAKAAYTEALKQRKNLKFPPFTKEPKMYLREEKTAVLAEMRKGTK